MAHFVPVENMDTLIAQLPRVVKRHPYIHYEKYPEVVSRIITILKNHRRGDIQKISQHTKFKVRTLYNWAAELKKNPSFNPLEKKLGKHKRIFTDEEEDAITDYIIQNILIAGILFTDEDFEDLIMTAFMEKYRNSTNIPHFSASKGFIYDFKKNHGIVSRKCHTKRRPDNKKYDQVFIQAMTYLFNNVDPHYIINIDETAWETVPTFLTVWHMKGQDHVVRYINANDKEAITVVAGISADGTKLPLQFIAKGETAAVIESQIGDVGYHMRSYSSKGWTTSETFIQYITGIRNHYGWDDKNTIHIILDLFKAHVTDKVKDAAKSLNIALHLIPAGMTDELQPLDKKIFGPLKTFARKLFHQRYQNSPEERRTKRDACQDMVRAWEKVTSEMIEESFEHFNEIETWCLGANIGRVNLKRHHRAFCTASIKARQAMESTEEYKE